MSSREPRGTDSVLRGLVALAALVVIVAGLRAASSLLAPLAVAAFISITSVPLVSWLEARRLPTWAAVVLTLVLVMLVLLGLGLVVQGAASRFLLVAPQYGARLSEMSAGWFEWFQTRGLDTSQAAGALNWTAVLSLAGGLFANAALVLSNALLVLFVVAFTLMEATGLPGTLARARLVDDAEFERFRRMAREVQRYLRVKTAISLATGLIVGAWTAAFGVDFAVLWGLLAFLLNYIPNFGSILAAVPPVLLALVQAGPGRAITIGAGYLAVNLVLGNVVEPWIMGRRLRISPLVLVLSLIFWGWVWGAVGMVLAVPITMIVRILFEQSRDLGWVAVLIAGRSEPRPADPPGDTPLPR